MSSIIPTNPSPQLDIALKWVEAFNKWDLDQLLLLTADDYTHYILPASLGIPPKTKEQYREYFTGILPMFVGFTVTIHEIIEGPGKVFMHASSTATSSTGQPYANEYSLVLHFTTQADGTPQISLVKEFVDSKKASEFFSEERKRQAPRQSQLESAQ